MTRTLDYSALTAPTTREAVRAFRTQMKAAGHNWGSTSLSFLKDLPPVAMVILAVVIGGGLIAWTVTSAGSSSDGAQSPTRFLAPLVLAASVLIVVARYLLGGIGNWERWMRLSRFAAANQFTFSPAEPNPQYPGSIFSIGGSRVATDRLRSHGDRLLDIGSYHYVTGSGKTRRSHDWGFMALRLDRKLPHMMLDATSNNSWLGTNLPASFSKDQVLSLEGDFDQHFTLYCPREYERDALYVFTPDLMALLIDEASPFDVEIVDDWMFVYSARAFAPTDPAVYQRLLRIVDTVGAKTLSQTDRYVDEKAEVSATHASNTSAVSAFAANTVAPGGRRLKTSFPIVVVIAVVLIAGSWIVSELLQIVGR